MKTIGLVLSGGGMRGVAHLGVLQVLSELGIEPATISGTSAGALVGAMHAAGHSIETIFKFFINTPVFKLGNLSTTKPGFIDTEKFRPLLRSYFPDDDFSALHKKLYVTTTDLIHGRSRTFSAGPLVDTLLASAAVPVVFSPVKIDNLLYTDGAALNNFPVEPLSGQHDIIIGVNVHPLKNAHPDHINSALKVMERIFHLTVHHHAMQKYHDCDLVITPTELARFGTFDRGNLEEIFEIGYRAAHACRRELLQLIGDEEMGNNAI
jgi:NTE family protein